MKQAQEVVMFALVLLWWAFCIGGCAYLVFWRDHSGWWFVLAVFLASMFCAKWKSE